MKPDEKSYFKQTDPFVVPTEDGKLIAEHFGQASTGERDYSVARMSAPPGWSEPPQRPEFDEITFMISGRKKVVVDGEEITVGEGESLLVKKGSRVQYSNPFDEPAEYLAVCVPAFSINLVNRE